MAKAYSNDLRCKLLRAYNLGQGSLRALAELFSVSYDWANKISRQRLRSQQMERVAQSRHGAQSRVTPAVEAKLLRQLREQPDSTLADLQKGLQQSVGVGIISQHL
jgi:transposase